MSIFQKDMHHLQISSIE